MKRQAMTVTIAELENLKQSLIRWADRLAKEIRSEPNYDLKFSIPIINKTECSDTWEFEK